jgi:hypothetical protein
MQEAEMPILYRSEGDGMGGLLSDTVVKRPGRLLVGVRHRMA